MAEDRAWKFDRYVDGRLKAEGVCVTRANTFEDACRIAGSMASPGSVLVLRQPDAMADKPIREQSALELLETHAKALESYCMENARLRAAVTPLLRAQGWLYELIQKAPTNELDQLRATHTSVSKAIDMLQGAVETETRDG